MLGFVASPFLFLAVFENGGRLHAQIFGVELDALEVRRVDARYTFAVAGVVVALAVIICVIVERIMTLRVRLHKQRVESAGLSAEMRKLRLQTHAIAPEKFADDLKASAMDMLAARNYHLWNGEVRSRWTCSQRATPPRATVTVPPEGSPLRRARHARPPAPQVQTLVTKRLEYALPPIAAWDDATGGAEHVRDIAELLVEMDDVDAARALLEARRGGASDAEEGGGGGGGGGEVLRLGAVAAAVRAKLRARLAVLDARIKTFSGAEVMRRE